MAVLPLSLSPIVTDNHVYNRTRCPGISIFAATIFVVDGGLPVAFAFFAFCMA
jgi:hypothetical protein